MNLYRVIGVCVIIVLIQILLIKVNNATIDLHIIWVLIPSYIGGVIYLLMKWIGKSAGYEEGDDNE